jgi:hypothetical protein
MKTWKFQIWLDVLRLLYHKTAAFLKNGDSYSAGDIIVNFDIWIHFWLFVHCEFDELIGFGGKQILLAVFDFCQSQGNNIKELLLLYYW